MTPSWIQTERTTVRKYWTVRLQSNKTTVVIIRGRQSSAISECQEKWPWEISPSWSHGQAWFVIFDIPRRVWRPIRARTHLATPQMKEWLRRSSNSTRKGRSHHHNTDKRPFVERKSRWMSDVSSDFPARESPGAPAKHTGQRRPISIARRREGRGEEAE